MPRYPRGMEVHTLPGAYHSGRATKAQLEFTLNKLLKGADPGADPTEINAPDQDLRTIDNVTFAQVTVGDVVFKNNWRLTEIENGIALIDDKGNIVSRWTNA